MKFKEATELSNDEDSFHIYLTSEQERLTKLKAEAGSRYFDSTKGHFLSALLSTDLRSIFHIITLKDTEEIFVYNSKTGIYEALGDKTLYSNIKFILGNGYSIFHAKATINDIKACEYTKREDFTVPIQFLPVENGVLDISKSPPELLPYDKKYYFTYQLPETYNSEAKYPKFLKFLSEILPEEKYRKQIQEMFGWCLRRDYYQQAAFMLIGEGSNGKSTLLAVLRCLLSKQNVEALSLQQICEDKFLKADLYQKFANISAEVPSKKIENSTTFKELTDGVSLVKAQKKYGQPFNFINYAKLIFATNELPSTKDKTWAYYRRWVLILFYVKFGDNGQPVNKKIFEEITTPEELSGILNWALEGLQRLNKQGDFSERLSVAETKDYYERLSNPVGTFLEEYVEETDNDKDYISKDYLWAELRHYCNENCLPKPTSKKQLAGEIKVHFENVESKQRKVGKKSQTWVWVNCKFSDDLAKLDYAKWVEEHE